MKKAILLLAWFLLATIANCQDWQNIYPGVNVSSVSVVDSILWINTESHLVRYNTNSEETSFFRDFDSIAKPIYPSLHEFNYAVSSSANPIVSINFEGLFELNGDQWIRYDESNTNIKPYRFYKLQYDRNNNLWFENGESFIFKRTDSLHFDSIQMEKSISLNFTFDQNNDLIINYYDKIAYVKEDSTVYFDSENSPLEEFNYLQIQFDSQNNIWIMENKPGNEIEPQDTANLFVFDGDVWERKEWFPQEMVHGNRIPSIFEIDSNDNKWFVGGGVIDVLTDTGWVKYNLTDSYSLPTDIGIINLETFYLSSSAYGLLTYADGVQSIDPIANNRLPGQYISDIAIDSESNVWICSSQYEYGMYALSLIQDGNWSVNNRISTEISGGPLNATRFYQDYENNLYTFVLYSPLHVFDGENWRVPKSIERMRFDDIALDRSGNLWAANSAYIYMFNNGYPEKIYESKGGLYDLSLAVDNSDNIWTIDYKHINLYTEDSIRSYTCNYSDSHCVHIGYTSLAIDNDNNVWIGSSDGILRYDGNHWINYTFADQIGINSDYVSKIVIDSSNIKYFGTYRGGLIIYDNKNWHFINSSNSDLISNSVNAIAFDNNNRTWLGTNHGISSFNKDFLGDTFSIEEFTVEYFVDHTSIPKESTSDLIVYPQPANDIIQIKNLDINNATLELHLLDINGREVMRSQYEDCYPGESYSLTCSGIASGLYILRIVSGNIEINRKVIIYK